MKWISVKDGLPKEVEDCVLAVREPTKEQLEREKENWDIILAARTDDDDWYDFADGERINSRWFTITHWMPLPERPSKEYPVTAFACGPRERCPDGSEHDYSEWENTKTGGTSVCAKCGHRAIDDAFWY